VIPLSKQTHAHAFSCGDKLREKEQTQDLFQNLTDLHGESIRLLFEQPASERSALRNNVTQEEYETCPIKSLRYQNAHTAIPGSANKPLAIMDSHDHSGQFKPPRRVFGRTKDNPPMVHEGKDQKRPVSSRCALHTSLGRRQRPDHPHQTRTRKQCMWNLSKHGTWSGNQTWSMTP